MCLDTSTDGTPYFQIVKCTCSGDAGLYCVHHDERTSVGMLATTGPDAPTGYYPCGFTGIACSAHDQYVTDTNVCVGEKYWPCRAGEACTVRVGDACMTGYCDEPLPDVGFSSRGAVSFSSYGTECVPSSTPASGVEICNGLDDDCDGMADNEVNSSVPIQQSCYTGPEDSDGRGECRAGTQTCLAGSYGACVGQTTPVGEVCNGLDTTAMARWTTSRG